MPRLAKPGLDYYPLDIDFFSDIRIRKLIRRQGGKAITIYVLLLCLIYKNGYYMRWDSELPFICSELSGYDEAYVSEVVKACLSLGLFDKALYDEHGVLTSKGIQERYCAIQRMSKRVVRMPDYLLIAAPHPQTKRKRAAAPRPKQALEPAPAPAPAPQPEAANSNAQRLKAFFARENSANLMALCKNLGLQPYSLDAVRQSAEEIIAEWELSHTTHRDYSDWSRHLMSTLRIKYRQPGQAEKSASAPSASDYEYDGGFGSTDV